MTNTSTFSPIDARSLSTVSGGADNGTTASGMIDVKTPAGIGVTGEGSFSQQWSNYADCRKGAVDFASGMGSPAEKASTYKDLNAQCVASFPGNGK